MTDCVNNKAPRKSTTSQSGPKKMVLETISIEPRVFRIQNFLSDFEADYIVVSGGDFDGDSGDGGVIIIIIIMIIIIMMIIIVVVLLLS